MKRAKKKLINDFNEILHSSNADAKKLLKRLMACDDMVLRSAFTDCFLSDASVRINKNEIDTWEWIISYISVCFIDKTDSPTLKTAIVRNSYIGFGDEKTSHG